MRKITIHKTIPVLMAAIFVINGCQVRELAYRALNRGEQTRSDAPIIPFTDAQIAQGDATSKVEDTTAPEITVWEGEQQVFPFSSAQRWLNVQGKAVDPQSGIKALEYTVNGEAQPHPLEIGPTNRRLAGVGDFNIELDASAMKEDQNQVTIIAVNGAGETSQETVTVEYAGGREWSLPYQIDWSTVTDLQEVAQVVDGLWKVTPAGVRTEQVGYDRVLAVGGEDWKDYEVTVPVTIHSIDERAYAHKISTNPGFGVNLRWKGHTDDPPVCKQPHCGWNPTGSSNWVELQKDGPALLKLSAEPPSGEEVQEISITLGQMYWIKARAQSTASGTHYSVKFWRDGESEPAEWTLSRQAESGNLPAGSLLLVAHHVNITFGRVSVVPLP